MDRKGIIVTIALFLGCSILFRAIDAAVSGSGKVVSLGLQAVVLVLIIGAIVVIQRRRS